MESVKEIMHLPAQASAEIWMPVLDIATAVHRHNFMMQVAQTLMSVGVDYGTIPGTNSKPSLLKPGAEKLCAVFGMSPEVHEEEVIEDWTGEQHKDEPFFYYRDKCRVTKNGILLGEGIGSCNSWETKYRYRTAERKCPECGAAAIIRGRQEFGGGWLCFARKGGCGAKFKKGDPAIERQTVGRVPNTDIADQVNTIQKMAHKRALVAAVLIATNASEFFTQDIEDMETIDVPVEKPASNFRETDPETVVEKPWNKFKEMLECFARVKEKFGTDVRVYYEILGGYGVKHANEFRDSAKALACYRDLEAAPANFPPAQPEAK